MVKVNSAKNKLLNTYTKTIHGILTNFFQDQTPFIITFSTDLSWDGIIPPNFLTDDHQQEVTQIPLVLDNDDLKNSFVTDDSIVCMVRFESVQPLLELEIPLKNINSLFIGTNPIKSETFCNPIYVEPLHLTQADLHEVCARSYPYLEACASIHTMDKSRSDYEELVLLDTIEKQEKQEKQENKKVNLS